MRCSEWPRWKRRPFIALVYLPLMIGVILRGAWMAVSEAHGEFAEIAQVKPMAQKADALYRENGNLIGLLEQMAEALKGNMRCRSREAKLRRAALAAYEAHREAK